MNLERSCGILLHITSLPGKYGIGTLGEEAFQFADLLSRGGQGYWQILPFGPVSPVLGYSPYASPSTFAGNPLFINLELLKKNSWITNDIETKDFQDADFIDFDRVLKHKQSLLRLAADDFFKKAQDDETKKYEKFCEHASFWLEDYALFTALAEHFNTNCWTSWDTAIALRKPAAITKWETELQSSIRLHKFMQYIFFSQWGALKTYCNSSGIKIIGDLPIYVTFDGADVWAHPEIFQLDQKKLKLTSVAGVPPDYFSNTGQLWGNPLYQWKNDKKILNEKTLCWWLQRIRHLRELVDVIRIDHFRGFESYWAVPAAEATAVHGKWRKGPGREFFKKLQKELGDLPFIAEDLGLITPEVIKLRKSLGLPGMKILQFAFDHNNKNAYLPHTYTDPNFVIYTGTHDNNTTNGWFYGTEIDERTRQYVMDYIGIERFNDFHWHLIRLAYSSVANLVIVPAQDILGYGSEFRMNIPGTSTNNWQWKLKRNAFTEDLILRLRRLAHLYNRIPERKNP